MEIRIKTQEEFRDDHVTIEIVADRSEVSGLAQQMFGRVLRPVDGAVSQRMFTAEEVGDYQASEAELVAGPLRRKLAEVEAELDRYRRAHVCTDRCQPQAHVAMEGRNLVVELEKSLAESRDLVSFKDGVIASADQDAIQLRSKVRELARGRKSDHEEIVALRQKLAEEKIQRENNGRWAIAEEERVETLNKRNAELARELAAAEKTVAELRDLVAFKTRVADEMDTDKSKLFTKLQDEREVRQRREEEAKVLHQSLAARDRMAVERSAELVALRDAVEKLAAQIGQVRGAVLGPEMRKILDDRQPVVLGESGQFMARRLRRIRDVVAAGGPGTVPGSPDEATSQA